MLRRNKAIDNTTIIIVNGDSKHYGEVALILEVGRAFVEMKGCANSAKSSGFVETGEVGDDSFAIHHDPKLRRIQGT